MTKQEMIKKSENLFRQVKSGKIKGKKALNAKTYAYALRSKARKAGEKKPTKTKIRKAPVKHETVKGQGFLPTFLGQMSMVRIEEMVSDKIFKALVGELAGVTDQVESGVKIEFPSDVKKRRSA